ncbi:unnamed protein product [Gongylonema pulchrum]|uniref:Regulator of chromosome condensation (RCC1) repeat-containing protein n=1 Tax=Gongylonema pulchrum TaxID=637853 RepID=A0A183DLW1_9BILA|nr:unnamed protein product [Gongylonema pulchrum]
MQVWSCGSNANGELGRGDLKQGTHTIYPVHLSSCVTIVQIAAGRNHNMAVADDGRLFAWGDNSRAQLALHPDLIICSTPT